MRLHEQRPPEASPSRLVANCPAVSDRRDLRVRHVGTRRVRMATAIATVGCPLDDVKLDPIDQGVVVDRASMSGPIAKRVPIMLARTANVCPRHGGEGK
jgi:hypothetical protein